MDLDSNAKKSTGWIPIVVVAVLVAVYLAIGLGGIGFGYCWDEELLILQVRDSIQNKLLLPTGQCNPYWPALVGGNYEYPMVLYWIGIATAIPDIIHRGIWPTGPVTSITDHFRFQMRMRTVCVVITSLSVIWAALAAARVTRRTWAAVLAAGLVVGCWELAYHSRFIATDAVMAQFAGVTLVCCLGALRSVDPKRRRRWLISAAVCAGLTTGTKYPGGMLVIPLLAVAWGSGAPGESRWRTARRMVKLFALQLGVFAVTTPGMFLQPWNFFGWVWFDHLHYGVYGHGVHTIRNHVAHLSAIAQFISLVLFSPSTPVSVFLTAVCVVGAVRLLWTDRRAAAVLLVFPLVYAGYFATQVAEIVRNLLVLVPFLVVITAVGADALYDGAARLRGRARSIAIGGLSVVLIGAIVFSVGWQAVAVRQIHTLHGTPEQIAAARAYLARHPELSVYPTDQAARLIGLPLLPASAGSTPVVIAFAWENKSSLHWPANLHHFARARFGVPEINPDDYPDWLTDSILIVDLDNARRVPSTEVEQAVARRDKSVAVPAGFALGPCLIAGGPESVTGNGVTIRIVAPATAPMPLVPAGSCPDVSQRWVDPAAITFEISGLPPGKPCMIGLSWWDVGDGKDRSESVWTDAADKGPGGQLLAPTILPRWTAGTASNHWPPPASSAAPAWPLVVIPAASHPEGTCRISVHRETGSDATVSSAWVDLPK